MRGTVAVIGRGGKEIDLFVARLKKEGYEVDRYQESPGAIAKVARSKPQAVFLTESCAKHFVQNVTKTVQRFRTKIPVIILANDPIEDVVKIRLVGEVFPLHQITLAEAMRRLMFAVELCHLTYVRKHSNVSL